MNARTTHLAGLHYRFGKAHSGPIDGDALPPVGAPSTVRDGEGPGAATACQLCRPPPGVSEPRALASDGCLSLGESGSESSTCSFRNWLLATPVASRRPQSVARLRTAIRPAGTVGLDALPGLPAIGVYRAPPHSWAAGWSRASVEGTGRRRGAWSVESGLGRCIGVHTKIGVVDDSGQDSDEVRTRGLELQSRIPRPSRPTPEWFDPMKTPSEGREVAGWTAYEVATEGPAAVVWLVRRFRHK